VDIRGGDARGVRVLRGVDVVDEGMRIGGVGNGDVIGRGIEGTVGVLVCWDVVDRGLLVTCEWCSRKMWRLVWTLVKV
jgi:hypothetical protein